MSVARHPSSREPEPAAIGAAEQPCQAREYLWAELRHFLLKIANQEIPVQVRTELNPSDLVQQSLLALHRRLPDFRGSSPEQFRCWARLVLHNRIVDARRRVERRPDLAAGNRKSLDEIHADEGGLIAIAPGATDEAILSEERQMLAEAIGRLPERHRAVLAFREEHGLSFSQIAEILDCSAGAARKLWARAALRLAEELKDRT